MNILRWAIAVPAGIMLWYAANHSIGIAFGIIHGFDRVDEFWEAPDMDGVLIIGTYIIFITRTIAAASLVGAIIYLAPNYHKQVAIIGRMNNFTDYILSLIMLAILPAMFEETIFRGGLQNLLSRWWKMPIFSIVVTAVIFSVVHGSYFGFLSRAVLGFVLGWMYYRTGNLWLNIIAHAANNAFAVTMIYVMRLKDPKMDVAKADVNLSVWWGLISLAVICGLLILFERFSQYQINKPGEEVIIRTDDYNHPSWVTDRP